MRKDIEFVINHDEIFKNMKSELKGKIKILDKLFNDGTITEEKYKIEVEPLKKKLEELSGD